MSSTGKLTTAFLESAAASSPARTAPGLDEELRARLDAGRAGWPGVEVDPPRFAAYLGERSEQGIPSPEFAADLYLACACALGAPAALDAFRRAFRLDVGKAIARTDASAAFLDEVMQILSVKLFVRTGDAPPAITQYSGRSSLRGWVCTAAKRTALNLRRAKGDQPHDEFSSGIKQLGTAVGPELALLKVRHKADFEESIRAGFASLTEKERSLLLLHLVNGVTLVQLAGMQNVGRSTVARWLASARESLFEATKAALVARMDVSSSEYESILAVLISQLDMSLVGALMAGTPSKAL
jgi:RNA polymerase sigma-70 factor (ECF subfamily)